MGQGSSRDRAARTQSNEQEQRTDEPPEYTSEQKEAVNK